MTILTYAIPIAAIALVIRSLRGLAIMRDKIEQMEAAERTA